MVVCNYEQDRAGPQLVFASTIARARTRVKGIEHGATSTLGELRPRGRPKRAGKASCVRDTRQAALRSSSCRSSHTQSTDYDCHRDCTADYPVPEMMDSKDDANGRPFIQSYRELVVPAFHKSDRFFSDCELLVVVIVSKSVVFHNHSDDIPFLDCGQLI